MSKKVTLYMDVNEGTESYGYSAYSKPIAKTEGWTRFAISVMVPDMCKPDEILPVHEFKEVDKD